MLIFLLVLALIYFLTKSGIVKTIMNVVLWLWLVEIAFGVGILIGVLPNLIKLL